MPQETLTPPSFLNRPAWTDAVVFLVVGPNFGCGSSREHAVWGLGQLGIRALIGTSFAGIFFDNCARNGLSALTLDPDQIGSLLALVSDPAREPTRRSTWPPRPSLHRRRLPPLQTESTRS